MPFWLLSLLPILKRGARYALPAVGVFSVLAWGASQIKKLGELEMQLEYSRNALQMAQEIAVDLKGRLEKMGTVLQDRDKQIHELSSEYDNLVQEAISIEDDCSNVLLPESFVERLLADREKADSGSRSGD